MARVAVIGGFGDLVLKLRGSLLRALVAAGHEVVVCVPAPSAAASAGVRDGLRALGIRLVEAPLDRTGTNPFREMEARRFYADLMRGERPDAVLAYNPKPIFYAVPEARRAGVPHVAAMVTGRGHAFHGAGVRARLLGMVATGLYRRALPMANAVIFQNGDDRAFFSHLGMLAGVRSVVQVAGPGVDLQAFPHVPLDRDPDPVSFLYVGRLLREKGVADYAEAARALRALRTDGSRMRFQLAGFTDANPSSVTAHDVQEWQRSGTLDYLGRLEDPRAALAACSVFVLPSHGEGMPMAVLEAMATGRAVVTCDSDGCRETIVDGESGILVPPAAPAALAVAMEQFLEDPSLAVRMGRAARERAERVFDARAVNAQVISAMGF